ncbi:MAG: TPM domain-containing protein, partial [Clostridiales bacterium]|nr:TPM domain-containing protein [Clostridiales bacterium]
VTVDSASGMTARRYAESCYDNGGYGKDGVLLFIDMDSREWYVCTSGSGKKLFTDAKIDSMMDTVLPSISGGDYYSGFYSFLRSADDTLYHDSLGNSAARNTGMKALFCVLIGFVISLIIVISQKKKLKTVRKQKNATAYMQSGSESITVRRDKFLYSQVTKVARPQSNSSGGSSSHGGHGGHF